MTEGSKNILVTGGAGYIGSHTCKLLAEQGYTPVSYDNLVYGHEHAVKWGPLEIGELADRERLDAVLEKYKPVAVIHFAAYAFVGESVVEPSKYYNNNIGGTLSLLDAMKAAGIDKIVFSSTCATYGQPKTIPITEDTPQAPINPYGHSKLMMEQILRDYDHAYDIRHVALRYFNACGCDRDGEIGEEHEPETHLIPRILMSLTGEIPKLTVFGTDYPTPDGTCIRDYIHVEDLASGHLAALEYLFNDGASECINLGTGDGFSVKEIIDSVERVTGMDVPREYGDRRPGDPPVLTADISKAQDLLDFELKASDVDNVVATAWAFHLSKTNRRRKTVTA
ncbi:MAG: UDP-glucose 4-epimerase GalE [Pseudomonadota bacterium]